MNKAPAIATERQALAELVAAMDAAAIPQERPAEELAALQRHDEALRSAREALSRQAPAIAPHAELAEWRRLVGRLYMAAAQDDREAFSNLCPAFKITFPNGEPIAELVEFPARAAPAIDEVEALIAKLRASAKDALAFAPQHIPDSLYSIAADALESLSAAQPATREWVPEDAARFSWWFGPQTKGVDINEYLRGCRERWTLDQWRAFVDSQMRAEPPHE